MKTTHTQPRVDGSLLAVREAIATVDNDGRTREGAIGGGRLGGVLGRGTGGRSNPGLRRTGPASVEFEQVSKRFGSAAPAIENLDLKINPGEFLTLLGPSGSGKTTALNLLAGFLKPTSGRILIDGKVVSDLPAHKRNVGVVFQHYALFPHLTVAQNIAYPLRQRGTLRAEIEKRVHDALCSVSLQSYADRLPSQLSGGQQQRVAVARATVFRPSLLLMDEPLGALDKKLRESVQLEIKRMHKELGVTIVFVTHDQEEALVMSDRIAVFNGGKIHQIGTATQLYDEPESQFVAQFLGDSNCWIGDVSAGDSGCAEVSGPGWRIAGRRIAATPRQGRSTAVVRPERSKALARGDRVEGWNHLPARIRDIVYLGSMRKIVADLDAGGVAQVVCQPDAVMPAGPEITIAFSPEFTRIVPASPS
ncbi:ABC transporter ATP-binding protein [Burkholderia stabilis]|uniref:ABC transporter ATP-binding protein n=1 Tax=Burkholderia stabilis TaxID=95485 RepID=UPI003132AE00